MQLPAVCPYCRTIFPSGISGGSDAEIKIFDVQVQCKNPICQRTAFVPDGVYYISKLAENIATELSDHPEKLKAASRLAKLAFDGGVDQEVAIHNAEQIHPKIGDLFKKAYNISKELLVVASCLATIYGAFVLFHDQEQNAHTDKTEEIYNKYQKGKIQKDALRPRPRPIPYVHQDHSNDEPPNGPNRNARRRAKSLMRKKTK